MRIDPNNLPLHIARAYGVRTSQPPGALRQTPAPAESHPAAKPDRFEPSQAVQQLIAGRVPGGVDFNSSPMSPSKSAAEVYQLYTRAADKIEAAIGVEVGRSLDVTG